VLEKSSLAKTSEEGEEGGNQKKEKSSPRVLQQDKFKKKTNLYKNLYREYKGGRIWGKPSNNQGNWRLTTVGGFHKSEILEKRVRENGQGRTKNGADWTGKRHGGQQVWGSSLKGFGKRGD